MDESNIMRVTAFVGNDIDCIIDLETINKKISYLESVFDHCVIKIRTEVFENLYDEYIEYDHYLDCEFEKDGYAIVIITFYELDFYDEKDFK